MLLDTSVSVAWEYMKYSFCIADSIVEFVEPPLVQNYMHCLETEDEDVKKLQEIRLKELKNKFGMQKLIIVPVVCDGHYSLVVADRRTDEVKLQYRDSLYKKGGSMEKVVKDLLWRTMQWDLPEIVNAARQPPGSTVCGVYTIFWMEQVLRAEVLGEAWCSLGWVEVKPWAERVQKLVKALIAEQVKLCEDADKAIEKLQKQKETQEAKYAAALKHKKVEDDVKLLGEKAAEDLKKIPPMKPCFENLSEVAKIEVNKASAGHGICSKCRWQSGCFACDGGKGLKYWLQKEGFLVKEYKELKPKTVAAKGEGGEGEEKKKKKT